MARSNHYACILAGGRGTRFWPRSRRRHPKQLLSFLGPESLLQQTVERLRPLIPEERIWILTTERLRTAIARQLPRVPPEQILAEPAQRNTAPCIGLGAHLIARSDPGAVMGVFPADQVITQPARFLRLVRAAYRAAEQDRIAVIGIQPRWAETGYGYVEFPEGVQPGSTRPLPVLRFREKPDAIDAERFLAAGRFYWNSGTFFWKAGLYLDLLRRHLPKTATLLASLPRARMRAALRRIYPLCENISVDYAVLEKADNVVGLAAGDIGWNDVGSWNAVYELLRRKAGDNVARGEALFVASSGNYVDAPVKLVALVGVDNLVVVDTPDGLLVAARDQAQKVSDLVKLLEQRKRQDLL